ncbi:hypothetical protein N656DRAFT_370840 [Canariomyces notabilis]|uniref:Uncharacterized protein n=1 Tax=Canariomyces notabilis TaxID=2074819 RepID=A0AAN6QF41_9PEZI|nr:hypothetical protein N656DRAFT_370840 [Canariomyces arenarius]
MQQQSNLALATEASPVKSGGIVTPGTGATRRKHASFGRDVKQDSGTTRASTTELPDVKVDLQQNPGRYRRRRHCDTNSKEECFLSVESGVKQGKDGDVIQLPQGKRRKARLRKNSLSLQAQQPPPTQGPKRRQSQRRNSRPQSSGASTLEEGALEADFASFEEWPLEEVLKRVWVGGAATFQVEFTWNPCTNHGTNHGQHDRVFEIPRCKSPGGRYSLTARALSSRVTPSTEKVQGDEYYTVEEILSEDREKRDWSPWSSGLGMGRSTILGTHYPLRGMS